MYWLPCIKGHLSILMCLFQFPRVGHPEYYSWMGDDKFGPSWCLRWVSSPSSLSWSVAWWYTIWPRVIRDCDNPKFVTLRNWSFFYLCLSWSVRSFGWPETVAWVSTVMTIFFIDTVSWCHGWHDVIISNLDIVCVGLEWLTMLSAWGYCQRIVVECWHVMCHHSSMHCQCLAIQAFMLSV